MWRRALQVPTSQRFSLQLSVKGNVKREWDDGYGRLSCIAITKCLDAGATQMMQVAERFFFNFGQKLGEWIVVLFSRVVASRGCRAN